MSTPLKRLIQSGFNAIGYEVVKHKKKGAWFPPDVSKQDRAVLEKIDRYTMTSVDRQISLIHAVRHIVQNEIPGCLVECGVWRGGSAMAMGLTLMQENANRNVYLYDTFEGMTPPTEHDTLVDGTSARSLLSGPSPAWGACIADLEEVRRNMQSTGFEEVHYIKGPVEQTLPSESPTEPIALLRLDTDWYESTKHELTHLYPLLTANGMLVLDDYGYWTGARQAVDEYFSGTGVFLHRIDDQGRMIVKQSGHDQAITGSNRASLDG